MAISKLLRNKSGKGMKSRSFIYDRGTEVRTDSENAFAEAEIVYQLEHPEKIVLDKQGDMYGRVSLAWNHHRNNFMDMLQYDFSSDTPVTILAPPLLMALCIRRYDLVEGLLKAGYTTVTEYNARHVSEAIGWCVMGETTHLFTIGQFIMGDPDMPDALRLLLWHQSAEERRRISKQRKQPRGKLFDFSTFDFEHGFASILFCKYGEKENTYFKTFMHTLKLVAKRRPRYLKNIVDENWKRMMCFNNYKHYEKIMGVLLHDVPLSEKMKCRLLELDCLPEIPTLHVGIKELAAATELLYKLKPYYKSERSKRALLDFGIKIYLLYQVSNDYIRADARRQKVEDKLVRLLRGCKARELSLSSYLLMFRSGNVVCSDWFAKILQSYRTVTGRKVVFDASIDVREVEPVVYLQQQYIHREKKQVVVDINEQTDWVEYIDSYEYSDPKELGTVQKQILKRCGQDMLLFAIRRKLLRGKQFDSAIAYCMSETELQPKVPCLLAYRMS